MPKKITPTKGELAGAENLYEPDKQAQITPPSPKRQAQCNDCRFYRWALHKKRGTRSYCSLSRKEISPVAAACEFAEV